MPPFQMPPMPSKPSPMPSAPSPMTGAPTAMPSAPLMPPNGLSSLPPAPGPLPPSGAPMPPGGMSLTPPLPGGAEAPVPGPGGPSGVEDPEELMRRVQEFNDVANQLQTQQLMNKQESEARKSDTIIRALRILQDLGVNPADPESITKYLTRLAVEEPDMAEMTKGALYNIFGKNPEGEPVEESGAMPPGESGAMPSMGLGAAPPSPDALPPEGASPPLSPEDIPF